MGKLASALRNVAMGEDARRQVVSLDKEFSETTAELQAVQAENLRLQALVNPLQREVEQLKERLRKVEEVDPLTHVQHTGLWTDPAGKLFCPKCHDQGKRNPVTTEKYGWRCHVCGKSYGDPNRPMPNFASSGGGGPDSWMGS